MSYNEDECLHGMPRNWCAICKGVDFDNPAHVQRNDDEDRFLNNLIKLGDK